MIGLIAYLVHRKLKAKAPEDPHMHKKVSILDFISCKYPFSLNIFLFSFFSSKNTINLFCTACYFLLRVVVM